jgi:hypothetical protein
MTIRLGHCPHCHASYFLWKGSHHCEQTPTTPTSHDELIERLLERSLSDDGLDWDALAQVDRNA